MLRKEPKAPKPTNCLRTPKKMFLLIKGNMGIVVFSSFGVLRQIVVAESYSCNLHPPENDCKSDGKRGVALGFRVYRVPQQPVPQQPLPRLCARRLKTPVAVDMSSAGGAGKRFGVLNPKP